tara:strand:+ start:188 stop:574 length:387 start_codon:yes stop_codon:yes gene_type:complete
MTKTAKLITIAGLIAIATPCLAAANPEMPFQGGPQHSGRFTPEDPAIYDLGQDWAVIFYYENAQGERVVVTTIAPKDPDSGRPASEHIVTLRGGESYRAALASTDSTMEPMHVTVRFDEKLLRAAANQ